MSRNGFPSYTSKAPSHRLKSNNETCQNETVLDDNHGNNTAVIKFQLPYAETNSEQLSKHCLEKISRCLKINIKFRVICDPRKYSFYCNMKDKTQHEQKHHVIYRLTRPVCCGKYIGKTERCLLLCMNEHGTRDTVPPMFKHLWNGTCLKNLVLIKLSHHFITMIITEFR